MDYAGISHLDKKAEFTIWKYFNRARYRATPYGYFSSCSTIQINSVTRDAQIFIEEKPKVISFTNWPYKNQLHFDDAHYFRDERIYISNESIYHTADSIRYIYRQEKLFELASIDKEEFIVSLLVFCKAPVSYQILVKYLRESSGLSLPETENLIQELLENQLLYTDLSPNIIGPDYFERMGVAGKPEDPEYLFTERKIITGTLSKDHFRHFNDCIVCLSSLAEEIKPPDLRAFKLNFIKRFEDREIPLLKALDPEIGIGYGYFTQPDNPDEMHELIQTKDAGATRKVGWGRLEIYLLQNMIEAGNNPNHTVQLENYSKDISEKPSKPLPNTFSALVYVIDDLVIVESIGGCTATSLLGRFTRSNKEIKETCKGLVRIESDANPDVIFFDIGYLSEDRVDNVNRRDTIYGYELPILVYSCSATPVYLQDIFVRVHQDEVILYSRQFGKRLIPRLATAYNYQRSDLSLYRFLCDLQQQGIKSQFNFDLESKIPGAGFYPRVQYKNIVLSPAKWMVHLKHFKDGDCRNLLEELGVSTSFKIRNNDQTLNFNVTNDEDLLSFKHYLKQQKKDFYIEEGFMPESPFVKDGQQNSYLPQFVLSFYHSALIYKGLNIKSPISGHQVEVSANILPGNDWLYFEIYCHPLSSNNLLTEKLWPMTSIHQEDIATWFFIRYLNPGHHLRLRLQLKPGADSYSILSSFAQAMKSGFDDGKIADIQIKPYKREIERYGADLIEQIEKHFCTDSLFVLNVLVQEYSPPQIYQLIVGMALNVLQSLKAELPEQLSLIEYYLNTFILEHNWESREFKNLNKRYASFQTSKTEAAMFERITEKQADLIRSFNTLLGECTGQRQKILFGDLFHMLINRLFAEHQRIHEGVIYYFMVKELQRQIRTNGA